MADEKTPVERAVEEALIEAAKTPMTTEEITQLQQRVETIRRLDKRSQE